MFLLILQFLRCSAWVVVVVALEVLLVVLAVLVDAVVVSLLMVMVEIIFFHHACPCIQDTQSKNGWAVRLFLRGCDVSDDFNVAEVCDVAILFFPVILNLGNVTEVCDVAKDFDLHIIYA